MRTWLVGVTVLLVAAPVALGQGRGRGGGAPVGAIEMLRPGLYVVPGGGANSLARVTSDGVVLVDTKMPSEENYQGLLAQIRTVTDQPVRYAIDTHHHADHTGNNARYLAAGVQAIGHQQLAANLDTYTFEPRPAKPDVTYDDAYTVRLGGAEVRVLHLGRAHTGGDSVVFFPDLGVVATSDAVMTVAPGPLVDYASGGSATDWLRVLDAMLALDFQTAVPGAGTPLTKADVQAFRAQLGTVIDRARALVRKGVPADELLQQIDTSDIGWSMRVPEVEAFRAELMGSDPLTKP
jgi:glyoxylase-like metal-dependent hydrolase (beta-lactamase superfamily II)